MRSFFLSIFLFVCCLGHAQPVQVWGDWSRWGDQGDGSYRNPVIPADFSDIDCIRVGDAYYAISSTFQYSPGMVIIRSTDLVNWHFVGHVVSDLSQIGNELTWKRMNRYGKGIWAGAIRFWKGRFYVYFGTPDEGLFMTSASSAEGPWEPLHCMKSESGWDDCCPFFEEDGRIYFVATRFADGYKTYLYQLTQDGKELIESTKLLINEGKNREANKLYKIGGTYYHFFSEVGQGGRFIMMQRAASITGPYLEKKQLSHVQRQFNEPNQGGLVEGPDGKWYFFTHHGTGDWAGRIASLLPVHWVEGWPIIGEVGPDGIGTMVWQGAIPSAPTSTHSPAPTSAKPSTRASVQTPQLSDSFDVSSLAPQWEWNYQPRNEMWSLTEKPGALRLKAFRPLEPDNLFKAGNTLTQRCFRTSHNEVVVKIDTRAMADGQKAGLCLYSTTYALLGVTQTGKTRHITFETGPRKKSESNAAQPSDLHSSDTPPSGLRLTGKWFWIKATWGLDGIARFSYSTNGRTYTPVGEPYQLAWGYYRGSRIGLYTYNNLTDNGHIDIDKFTYTINHQHTTQMR